MTLPALLVVIHETFSTAERIMRLHGDPQYLASYHAVIRRNGSIVYLVPPEHKAFAAGLSVYINPVTEKEEAINGSVDDFAYQIALESPVDGLNRTADKHSGYTYEQYHSLAWLLRATGVSIERIVKHSDISGEGFTLEDEPRCLNMEFVFSLMNKKTNNASIDFGIVSVDPIEDNIDDDLVITQKSKLP